MSPVRFSRIVPEATPVHGPSGLASFLLGPRPCRTSAAEFRFAFRSLFRRPGAALLMIVSLATTIGFASAAFSVLDAVVWRSLPVRAPSELVEIWAKDRQQRPDQLSWLEFQAVASRRGALSAVVAQSRHSWE